MKNISLFLIFFMACIPNYTWAFDTRDFHQVLGVDVNKHYGASDDFKYLLQRFGKAKVVKTGDASTSNIQINYVTQDKTEEVAFYFGECDNGYWVSLRDPGQKIKNGWGILKNMDVRVAGISLGMFRAEVEKLMPTGKVEGGFRGTLEKGKNGDDYKYVRKIKVEGYSESQDAETYIYFRFSKSSKLEKFGLSEGGCY